MTVNAAPSAAVSKRDNAAPETAAAAAPRNSPRPVNGSGESKASDPRAGRYTDGSRHASNRSRKEAVRYTEVDESAAEGEDDEGEGDESEEDEDVVEVNSSDDGEG